MSSNYLNRRTMTACIVAIASAAAMIAPPRAAAQGNSNSVATAAWQQDLTAEQGAYVGFEVYESKGEEVFVYELRFQRPPTKPWYLRI